MVEQHSMYMRLSLLLLFCASAPAAELPALESVRVELTVALKHTPAQTQALAAELQRVSDPSSGRFMPLAPDSRSVSRVFEASTVTVMDGTSPSRSSSR